MTYEEKTSEDYVEALADRYPHLSRAEMLLTGVRDWADFNAKLRMERYAFPTEFIFKEIDVESWKNIPIPLMEATECLERGLVNVSNVLGEIIHEQKARSNFVAARMADIATEADDAQERTRRALEQTRRALAELVEQFKTKAANALEQQRLQLTLVHQEVQNDREYLQTRLMHMDDTTVIKGWVEGELKKMEDVLRNEYTSELRLLRHQMDKVWDENLLVPELIGDNELCLYRNLKEFCEAQKREFYQFRDDFEPTTARMIGEKVISVKNPLTIKINDLKKELADFKKEVAQSNSEVAATVAAERQYVETSLGEVIP